PAARAADAAGGRVHGRPGYGAPQRELLLQPPGARRHRSHATIAGAGDHHRAGAADRRDPVLDLPADLRRDLENPVLTRWRRTTSTSRTRGWRASCSPADRCATRASSKSPTREPPPSTPTSRRSRACPYTSSPTSR